MARDEKDFRFTHTNIRLEKLEATPRGVRAERFATKSRKMQQQAVRQGLNAMTMKEIDAEIAKARNQ